jgi:hypothetical protein
MDGKQTSQRAIAPVREPLGGVSSRVLKSATRSRSLPGAPDAEYLVVQFQTSFANKAATETVVLSHEASGWNVDDYFIRWQPMSEMGRKQT